MSLIPYTSFLSPAHFKHALKYVSPTFLGALWGGLLEAGRAPLGVQGQTKGVPIPRLPPGGSVWLQSS